MGKVELFTITFHKENAIYTPGETVAGNLVLRVSERFKINLVNVLVQGYAKTFWLIYLLIYLFCFYVLN